MATAHDELNALYQELRDELNRLAKDSGSDEEPLALLDVSRLDPLDRRLIVRSAFAAIEAIAYRLKQVALDPRVAFNATTAERALCAEEAYDLSSTGEPEVRAPRLRFLPNLRFAFGIAAKADAPEFALKVSEAGWQAVQSGVRIRDRLMHPKELSDLAVTDDELRVTVQAFRWVEEQVAEWLQASVRAEEAKATAFKLEAERLQREIVELRSPTDRSAV